VLARVVTRRAVRRFARDAGFRARGFEGLAGRRRGVFIPRVGFRERLAMSSGLP
jgi:hypothetical protein